jgi:hypothetical protein
MAVISIRLNSEEEKMIAFLADQYERDKSSLIKLSLKEMYEDFIDKNVIDEFESKEKKHSVKYIKADEIIRNL